MTKTLLLIGLTLLPLLSRAALFDDGDAIFVQTSIWTLHFSPDEDHSNNQRLLNVELDKASGWAFGIAAFRNSFDQPSQYLYAGYIWDVPKTRDLAYFKLTGGLLHGYKGEHQDAVPYNSRGVSPAILPIIGIKYKRVQSELTLFGTAGMMFSVGVNFPLGESAKAK
jgi:hypothetical protein